MVLPATDTRLPPKHIGAVLSLHMRMAMHSYDDHNGFFTEAGHVDDTFSFPGQHFNPATRSEN